MTPNASATDEQSSRLIALDILRAFAILLVLGAHRAINPKGPIAAAWTRIGWSGVDLFFVLSGFLIGGLLFAELKTHGSLDVRRFLIRRALKIWPLYYLYVLGEFCYQLAIGKGEFLPRLKSTFALILPSLMHLQNYLGSPSAHTWSLAVEEHFYLALPLLLWWLTRRTAARGGNVSIQLARIPAIVTVILVGCLMLRLFTSKVIPEFKEYIHVFPTHLRADGLAFGVLLAYLHHFVPRFREVASRRVPFLLITGCLMLIPFALYPKTTPFIRTFGVSLLDLAYGAILVGFLYADNGSQLSRRIFSSRVSRGLAFVGLFSYPIYLFHMYLARVPVRALLKHGYLAFLPPGARWFGVTLTYVLLCLSVAVVFGKLIEVPTLALRDRLYPPRSRALTVESPATLDERETASIPELTLPSPQPAE